MLAESNLQRRPWRRLLIRCALALAAAVGAWLPLEIGYRLAHGIPLTGGTLYQEELRMPDAELAQHPWYRDFLARFRPSDDPILFYEPRPGYRGAFRPDPETGAAAEIAINSQGFRDREYALEKEPGTFRIAVLGDSIVWGHGLALEDTFPKQLERALGEAQPRRVEVLNFGVSGYSTRQEVELYRVKASRFRPDLVIVGYCLNDAEDSSVEGQAFRRLYYDLFSHSYVLGLVRQACDRLAARLGLASGCAELPGLRAEFERLQASCGAARILVVVFPELADFARYSRLDQHRSVAAALAGTRCELVDLLGAFQRYDAAALRVNPRDNTHPNALANQVAAETVLRTLLAKPLEPLGSG